MKKLIAVISLLALGVTARAQTNAASPFTNVTSVVSSIAGTNTAAVVGFVVNELVDAQPYFTNGNVLAEAGALKLGSHYGGFMDVQFPVSTNNWQITCGVAAGAINGQLYTGSFNLTLGTTVNLPLIGQYTGPLYAFASSGPGWNFHNHGIVAESFVGVKYYHSWTATFGTGGSYGIGTISDIKGNIQEFSLMAGFKL
jgi:hypothetical protein